MPTALKVKGLTPMKATACSRIPPTSGDKGSIQNGVWFGFPLITRFHFPFSFSRHRRLVPDPLQSFSIDQ